MICCAGGRLVSQPTQLYVLTQLYSDKLSVISMDSMDINGALYNINAHAYQTQPFGYSAEFNADHLTALAYESDSKDSDIIIEDNNIASSSETGDDSDKAEAPAGREEAISDGDGSMEMADVDHISANHLPFDDSTALAYDGDSEESDTTMENMGVDDGYEGHDYSEEVDRVDVDCSMEIDADLVEWELHHCTSCQSNTHFILITDFVKSDQ